MVDRLHGEHPDLDVRRMDATRIDSDDASFDVVTAGFLMHLLDAPDRAAVEVRRVLRPGGLFAFTVIGPPPDGFAPGDISAQLFAEYAPFLPPGGSMGTAFDEHETLRAAGFTDATRRDLR